VLGKTLTMSDEMSSLVPHSADLVASTADVRSRLPTLLPSDLPAPGEAITVFAPSPGLLQLHSRLNLAFYGGNGLFTCTAAGLVTACWWYGVLPPVIVNGVSLLLEAMGIILTVLVFLRLVVMPEGATERQPRYVVTDAGGMAVMLQKGSRAFGWAEVKGFHWQPLSNQLSLTVTSQVTKLRYIRLNLSAHFVQDREALRALLIEKCDLEPATYRPFGDPGLGVRLRQPLAAANRSGWRRFAWTVYWRRSPCRLLPWPQGPSSDCNQHRA
jgi:hypothetical protein